MAFGIVGKMGFKIKQQAMREEVLTQYKGFRFW